MKVLRNISVVAVFIFLFSIETAVANNIVVGSNGHEVDSERTIPEGMVHIINTINGEMHFSLSFDGETWNEVSLGPKQDEVYEFARYIKISTQNTAGETEKAYKLEQSRRYEIVWNEDDALYDVVKLSNN